MHFSRGASRRASTRLDTPRHAGLTKQTRQTEQLVQQEDTVLILVISQPLPVIALHCLAPEIGLTCAGEPGSAASCISFPSPCPLLEPRAEASTEASTDRGQPADTRDSERKKPRAMYNALSTHPPAPPFISLGKLRIIAAIFVPAGIQVQIGTAGSGDVSTTSSLGAHIILDSY